METTAKRCGYATSAKQAGIFKTLTHRDLKLLTTEVKETLALHLTNSEKKVFTAAQLWDLHRRRKNFTIRRNYF